MMNQGRSSTSGRPLTSGRPGTSGKSVLRPPTSMRTISMTSSGGMGPVQGVSAAPPISVADRPMTQHGLGGLKTGSKPLRRTVQDKSYFMGVIRSKIGELNREIVTLNGESDSLRQEQATHRSYDQTATELASEIKRLLEEMADYNTAADKLSTDTTIEDVKWEYQQLKQNNEIETKMNENLFSERQRKEAAVDVLQKEIDELKAVSDKLITNMKPELRGKYLTLKKENNELQSQIDNLQSQIAALNEQKASLEQTIAGSDVKQEAFSLNGKIRELEENYNSLLEEEKLRGTPAEEREKLLKQVKENNLEISNMERHSKDIKDQINKLNEAIGLVEEDLEIAQSERNQQYLELRKREDMMNTFLGSFEQNQSADTQRVLSAEEDIVKYLEKISFNLIQCQQLPTFGDLHLLKEDFELQDIEVSSQSTVRGLLLEKQKHKAYLKKMDQLEIKMATELDSLKAKIRSMEKELLTFEDINNLRESFQEKEAQWKKDRINLSSKIDNSKSDLVQLTSEHDDLKKKLNENEAHVQLGNLERKWQHLEQANFTLKDYNEKKKNETNYSQLTSGILKMFADYNNEIIKLSRR